MKTKEELNALKEEVETLNEKLHELTDEELAQVSGGVDRKNVSIAFAKSFVGSAVGLLGLIPTNGDN